ncbi:hypothetical protein ECSTECDG1313_1753 [Escherichia coli STEC_DG131-3]|nr:hypothetical protein ECSTECDG1313_1753 [Escherichia coli STEC_DG131-3]
MIFYLVGLYCFLFRQSSMVNPPPIILHLICLFLNLLCENFLHKLQGL